MIDQIKVLSNPTGSMRHPFEQHEQALQALLRHDFSPRNRSDPGTQDRAIEALYEAAIQAATRFCKRLNFRPHRERATEAVHEWFCQLRPHRAKGYRPELPLFPYAYLALWYITLGMAKREAHHAAHPLADDPSDRRREPVHLIDLLEIDDALLKLSADLLDSISLRFYVGLTSKEAAEMLNISPGAFNNRVHRAIEILRREWLGPDGR